MKMNPYRYQDVEILIGDHWVPAVFHAADFIPPGDGCEVDEIWWMDYFALADGKTIPEDIHSGDELPQWRAAR